MLYSLGSGVGGLFSSGTHFLKISKDVHSSASDRNSSLTSTYN